ncbi:alanine racemase [Ensifer sp. B1-9]|uniref:alanine racemase n=1 Tax=Ensifer sp. B1-9 TaxID=3141455 RepID=UPI003D201052
MNAIETLAAEMGRFQLTPGLRGVPIGTVVTDSASVKGQGWHPADGEMSLPLLSLDLQTYAENKAVMLEVCRVFGCEIAPHAKTPMSPVLARDLVESGAWGISVADLRQAEVMLHHGFRKLLIANEIGGRRAAVRLARLLSAFSQPDIHLFVDSAELVAGLAETWGDDTCLPPLKLLVEVGCGRGGVNSNNELDRLLAVIGDLNEPRITLAGVAAYEGTANRPGEAELLANLDDLFSRVSYGLMAVRRLTGEGMPLILSMGGSSLFDHVITRCRSILDEDGNASLLLRSGACFFSDNGPIRTRLRAIARRGLLGAEISSRIAGAFEPTLRLWAEVLSVNGSNDVICGVGLRDVAHDQGVPTPLVLWRNGKRLAVLSEGAMVSKLNDQHAFVHVPGCAVELGDVIEFGINHPCTTIDKHDVIFGLDDKGAVSAVLRTFFG